MKSKYRYVPAFLQLLAHRERRRIRLVIGLAPLTLMARGLAQRNTAANSKLAAAIER